MNIEELERKTDEALSRVKVYRRDMAFMVAMAEAMVGGEPVLITNGSAWAVMPSCTCDLCQDFNNIYKKELFDSPLRAFAVYVNNRIEYDNTLPSHMDVLH